MRYHISEINRIITIIKHSEVNEMKKRSLFGLILGAIAIGAFVSGCDSNPTNEPTAKEIDAAVEAKYKAIDNDPSMNAAQKAEMKKHIAGPAKQMPDEKRGN